MATTDPLDLCRVTSATGRPLIARILRPGDRYGREDCLVWGEDAGRGVGDPVAKAKIHAMHCNKLGIEFWDATKLDGPYLDPVLGQFTGARFFVENIIQGNTGLMLQGDVRDWDIASLQMIPLRTWLFSRI